MSVRSPDNNFAFYKARKEGLKDKLAKAAAESIRFGESFDSKVRL